ncbi:interleukin-17 receptor E [Mastacembelus armatus]|uniref:Interleukin-17 receptor E-like n=1 Tax=Mastacembelus armatus TaxID=205130 RepID=A0A3Q3NNR5_9TELE|nr:interleukin-17 receptor E-like [Mastacembelus armatus]
MDVTMRICAALSLFVLVVSPLLLDCTITCQMGDPNGYPEGGCPVRLTPAPSQSPQDVYSQCVTVHVWMTADDLCKSPKIEILSSLKEIIRPTLKKRNKCSIKKRQHENRVKCDQDVTQHMTHSNTSVALWELMYRCVRAEAKSSVSVSYNTTSTSCSESYTVPDPVPDFDLSLNQSSKLFVISVASRDKVYARWCYQRNAVDCTNEAESRIIIDPSQSRSAQISIPYVLPCVCVQVYYTHIDARRHKKCPFQKERIADTGDVWRSSEVTLYESSLKWSSRCPVSDLKISASLCWRQHDRLCTPVLNSTLEENEEGTDLIYNTSAVDKHPQMCVQFSLQDSPFSCPFQADMSSWEVDIGLGRQSVFVHITSSVPAKFSAQLCVLNEMGCTPIGLVHTLRVEGSTTKIRINLSNHFLADKPCVQVWQSDPALHGRRILCPDYTHYRCGLYALAALVFVVIVALVGIFIHRLTKSGAAGWLYIQKPVLVVCSSEQSAHVSAVCALASMLQGELSATVHLALWSHSSQRQAGATTGNGVADLGPLPWLYGQWEVVREEQGKVLIIWSPEAKKIYETWTEERENRDKNERNKDNSKADISHRDVKEDYKLCDDEDWYSQTAPSTVITSVFAAALACLESSLQQCKGKGVAIVYFQGLGHSKDIPKALRGVPQYCLPQDFRGLIQELGGMRRRTKNSKLGWHCWSRLLSKVLLIWLARQLAHRLQTLLEKRKKENAGVFHHCRK